MGYVDLDTIHNPTFGNTPTVGYGDQIDLNFKAMRGKPRMLIRLAAAQAIPDDEPTLLTWGTGAFEDIDTHGAHSGGQPTRFVVPADLDGDWRLTSRVLWEPSVSGTRRFAEFLLNGATQLDFDEKGPSTSGAIGQTNWLDTIYPFDVGHFVTVRVYHDHGGDLDAAVAGVAGCVFTAEFVGKGVG